MYWVLRTRLLLTECPVLTLGMLVRQAREPGALGDQWEVDLGEPQVLTPYALATFCPVLTAVVPRS